MLRSNAPKYGESAQGQLEANDIAPWLSKKHPFMISSARCSIIDTVFSATIRSTFDASCWVRARSGPSGCTTKNPDDLPSSHINPITAACFHRSDAKSCPALSPLPALPVCSTHVECCNGSMQAFKRQITGRLRCGKGPNCRLHLGIN